MCSKKGESLVEVVVALGIFAFVFMGVVNVMAGSITLNVSARQRMETVAMVQKNFNEYLAVNTNLGSCSITGRTPTSPIKEIKGLDPTTGLDIPDVGCSTRTLNSSNQTCYWLELANLDSASNPSEINSALGLDNTNFIKVVSHGKWYTRILGEQKFDVSSVIRNNR